MEGRGVRTQYSYNLVLFKEIKRFWQYREQLGFYAVASNLLGNVLILFRFGFFLPMASTYRNFFLGSFLQFQFEFYAWRHFQLLTMVGSFDVDDLL